MNKLFKALDGKKTYLGLIAWGVYNIAADASPSVVNLLSPEIVNTALTAWIGIAFRDALAKLE